MKGIQKGKAIFVTLTLLLLSIISSTAVSQNNTSFQIQKESEEVFPNQIEVSCDIYGYPDLNQPMTQKLNQSEITYLQSLFESLQSLDNKNITNQQHIQQQILQFAEEKNLLPQGFSERFNQPPLFNLLGKNHHTKQNTLENEGKENFCNIISFGEGSSPTIIFPKLVPFIILPLPRLYLRWQTDDGFTSVGGYYSRTGYLAQGEQIGTAWGFWGVGFNVFFPPFSTYGLLGYSLSCKLQAEDIDFYPPNYPPEVNAKFPLDGAEDIQLEIETLDFYISDGNQDKMSYTVTTDSEIGSGNGQNKDEGEYSIDISGLEGSKEYCWTVEVTDGKSTTEKTFSFTTIGVSPKVTQESPSDGQTYVPLTLNRLKFSLSEPQGQPMSYTVETQPNVGSYQENGVSNGAYEIPISGLEYGTEYDWYVNVTDGENWKHEHFSFTTANEHYNYLIPSADTKVGATSADTNHGESDRIGLRNGGGYSIWEIDILMDFDLSIYEGEDIESAELKLYYYDYKDRNPAGRIFTLHYITESWDEYTVTWNNRPSYDSTIIAQATCPIQEGAWISFDVTDSVQHILDGEYINHGWIIKDPTTYSGVNIPWSHFRTKEYNNPEYIPRLEITSK